MKTQLMRLAWTTLSVVWIWLLANDLVSEAGLMSICFDLLLLVFSVANLHGVSEARQ